MPIRHSTDSNRAAGAGPRAPEATPADPQSAGTPGNHGLGWFGRGFYACGGRGLPARITCLGGRYVLEKVLKHDFHAATGLYRKDEFQVSSGKLEVDRPPETSDFELPTSNFPLPVRLIGKINRRASFCLLPLGWIGRLMARHEVRNLRRCEGIAAVPRVLARLDGHMYVYEYIEGWSLNENPPLPADFFDRLVAALREVHARGLVHFDLHKRGNILVDTAGRPHLIDFQISQHLGDRCLLSRRLSASVRRWLQSYDLYHIYKHKRRLQPERLTAAEKKLSYNHSLGLEIQRAIARPYKRIRRACLRYLYAKGILAAAPDGGACVETNPVRWIGRPAAAAEQAGAPAANTAPRKCE